MRIMKGKVIKEWKETEEAKIVRIKPEKPISFQAGQFIMVYKEENQKKA